MNYNYLSDKTIAHMTNKGKFHSACVSWFDEKYIHNNILAKHLISTIGAFPVELSDEIRIRNKPEALMAKKRDAYYWHFITDDFTAIVEVFWSNGVIDDERTKLKWVSPNNDVAREALNKWLKQQLVYALRDNTIWIDAD